MQDFCDIKMDRILAANGRANFVISEDSHWVRKLAGEPQYPLALWNHNKDAVEVLTWTTNTMEG